jgi:hypothetical protein
MPGRRIVKRRLQFSLRVLLLLFTSLVLLAGFAAWLLRPAPLDVRISYEPFSFPHYDDYAGNLPLGAIVRITNVSKSTAWFLGGREDPVIVLQQLVDGTWESIIWSADMKPGKSLLSSEWTRIRSMESISILAGPISEQAAEVRVGMAFTSAMFTPTEAHWVFGPVVEIVKKGQGFFPTTKTGATQEEQVLSLAWPSPSWQNTGVPISTSECLTNPEKDRALGETAGPAVLGEAATRPTEKKIP